MLSTSQIDLEIANKMRNMTPQEAAAVAAQAVAEAEAAIAEAEEAARDAEAHEADAEAAKAFSDATKTLHGRSAPRMVRHTSISIIGSILMASIVYSSPLPIFPFIVGRICVLPCPWNHYWFSV